MLWIQNFRCNHKFVVMVWCLFTIKGQGAMNRGGGKLVRGNFMVGQILQELVEEKNKTYTMDGRSHSKPFDPN